jgi:hypothetical protein
LPFVNLLFSQSAIQLIIQRDLPDIALDGRRTALSSARSLQKQLFFYEVEGDDKDLTDGVEGIYHLMDDPDEPGASSALDREELPNGIITTLTKCYASTCADRESEGPCYAWSCPKKVVNTVFAFHSKHGGLIRYALLSGLEASDCYQRRS